MELGSEYPLGKLNKPCRESIFEYLKDFNSIYVDSGRSAMRLLDMYLPQGPILLPAYICKTVLGCFLNRQVLFYSMTDQLEIDWHDLFRKMNSQVKIVYLYYFNGILPESVDLDKFKTIKEKNRIIAVEDTTHSIFSAKLTVGDYGLCSLRKWFPISDGGVLYGNKIPNFDKNVKSVCAPWSGIKYDAMALKKKYLNGQCNEIINTIYLRLFRECDCELDRQRDIFRLSEESKNILEGISVPKLIAKRQKNIMYLREHFIKRGITFFAQPKENECPLFCPIKTNERDNLRKFLISKQIYCAVHWPMEGTPIELLHESEMIISKKELSLPIDQRYDAVELDYLMDSILQYRGT